MGLAFCGNQEAISNFLTSTGPDPFFFVMYRGMGVTEEGYKKVLGFTQATTERAEPVVELLRDLIERGLTFKGGSLRHRRLEGTSQSY